MGFINQVQQHLSSLSPGKKKAADYIIQNLEHFSYATLANLSKEVGVSETTIIRLSYSLGFDSFSQMQNAVRNELLKAPVAKTADAPLQGNFYADLFEKEIEVIRNMSARLDPENMDKICTLLGEADNVLLVGARATYTAAEWFGSRLYQMRPNVHIIQPFYDSRLDLIQKLTPSSVVFCISFPRYARWTCQYAETAKSYGAQIIALTDSLSSPLLSFADHMLLIDLNQNEMGISSHIPMYCLFDALLSRLFFANPQATAHRLKEFENINKNFHLFFE